MSAAAPLPPPGPRPRNAMKGYTNGAHSVGAPGWRAGDWGADGGGDGGGDGDGGGPGAAFPSIADITASANEKVNELRHTPIGRLMAVGEHHFKSAITMLNSRNPTGAFWEYLVAYQVVVDVLPRHPDYYDKIDVSRGSLHRDFKELTKDVRSAEERFVRIKEIIVNDNKRSGVLSSTSPSSTSTHHSSSRDSRLSNGSIIWPRDDELMLPDVPTALPQDGRSSLAVSSESPRKKPSVQPKPQSLHGRALHQTSAPINGSTATDDLAQRFARLSGASVPINTVVGNTGADFSVKMPSPSDYHSSSQPLGPRDMPPPPAPPASLHPPKLALSTQMSAAMPREPSPTYSPARNLSLPPSINPPRSTARSMVGTGGRSNSLAASSASAYPPGSNGDADSYFPPLTSDQGSSSARRKSVHKPMELQINVDKLYDYIRMYNLLLIDVRSREEFDSGHIYVHNIMCIEPTALQDGCSAEQLQDRLVLSPDAEQLMFERRNEYDLVIYYDESTKSNAFLNKYVRNEKDTALKRLYDTLYEFNAEKPLQRPPIFLMGGVDAWTELVGTQALKMSTTATVATSGQARSRAMRRAPAASHIAWANLQRRRLREYTSMDPEEERKWLEEARRGRAVFEQPLAEEGEDEELGSPMYRTPEDFLRRFPEVDVEQQSMIYPPSRPAPPTAQYVAPPIPQAPSRPPPSVPRVSYSGVHERQLAPQARAQQLPVYISPGRYGQIRLHKTGLVNFGVTCYMNSVVQCLAANMDLSNIFLSQRYQNDLQKENWKGTKGIIPEAYATLISNLFKGDVGSIRPSTFRRVCGHFNSQWTTDEQQDAKEFLEFLLDCLHEDLNITWAKPPLKQLSEADEIAREKLPRQYVARVEWGRYLYRESSLIGNMFAGQHASQLTCATCGTTSTTYEAFWSISVEIPRDRPADVRECLQSYCSTEQLSGDDIWRCPHCKQDREATKKITITRAPDFLVLHLKRFSASRMESARKVRTPINFPLHGLDLAPYMEPPITEEQEAYVISHARDAAAQLTGLKTDPTMNGPYIYNAYAVIWHLGSTLGSGHYVAMVRDKSRGCWRSYNDERLQDFEPRNLSGNDRLQSEKAYIVFYERERVAGGAF
ncbi:cysteine proteinase [Lindgomyces ingoldianus]|uniref:Cysteine proteinase n=1 Tax=Lindgomyces ingoldianus TaxID=673940 RepID=A0ACB6QZX0_9PLEO|nr:cysteine proteinase [Lindgomyces ingoldianus]KAF2472322.1 cysteine proteinase [Lindgomyces ingoldianus]